MVKNMNKKGVSIFTIGIISLIAIVITVTALGGVTTFFQNKLISDAENTNNNLDSKILEIDLIENGRLYVNNKNGNDVIIKSITVNGDNCVLPEDLDTITGISDIDLTQCLKNHRETKVDIVISTNKGIIKKMMSN